MASVSTTAALGEKAEWVSATQRVLPHHTFLKGSAFADQKGTLHIEQSSDGENWDVDSDSEIAASEGIGIEENLVGRYWRARYVNGTAAQGVLRLNVRAWPGNAPAVD